MTISDCLNFLRLPVRETRAEGRGEIAAACTELRFLILSPVAGSVTDSAAARAPVGSDTDAGGSGPSTAALATAGSWIASDSQQGKHLHLRRLQC